MISRRRKQELIAGVSGSVQATSAHPTIVFLLLTYQMILSKLITVRIDLNYSLGKLF